MSLNFEYINTFPFSTSTISVFSTDRTQLTRSESSKSFLSSNHITGIYELFINELEENMTLDIIHRDFINLYLDKLSEEKLDVNSLGTINISNHLIISDPCYIYDGVVVDPLFPRFQLCIWGRDESLVRKLLIEQGILFHINDDGSIQLYGNDRRHLELTKTRLYRELRVNTPDLHLADWLKDTENLYDQIQTSGRSRLLNYSKNGKIYEGVVVNTKYGNDNYKLYAFKHANEIIGFKIEYKNMEE